MSNFDTFEEIRDSLINEPASPDDMARLILEYKATIAAQEKLIETQMRLIEAQREKIDSRDMKQSGAVSLAEIWHSQNTEPRRKKRGAGRPPLHPDYKKEYNDLIAERLADIEDYRAAHKLPTRRAALKKRISEIVERQPRELRKGRAARDIVSELVRFWDQKFRDRNRGR